nr:YciI family protein [Luteimicrobium subarcticum]
MPFFAVSYAYSDDVALRDEHRPAHRAHLRELLDAGVLAASGPLGAAEGEPDGALLVVRAPDADGALAVLDDDPFLATGVVAARSARRWDPVMGPWSDEL